MLTLKYGLLKQINYYRFSDNFSHLCFTETVQEYCVIKEPFQANCIKNEVIVMKTAIYGRMKIGRCLESEAVQLIEAFGNDPKFLGCSEDVLKIMDNKCSGKNRCEVRIPFDSDFDQLKPCHDGLKLYLEASYDCITGKLQELLIY